VLADATDFLVSDVADVAAELSYLYGPTPNTPPAPDRSRSFVERVRSFQRNAEIDTTLTITSSKPPLATGAAPTDRRAVSLGLRWSLFALPDTPMPRRAADKRIGYFGDTVRDFGAIGPRALGSDVDFLYRWRLEKKDPRAPLSEPGAHPLLLRSPRRSGSPRSCCRCSRRASMATS
jgi:hypothetical protein